MKAKGTYLRGCVLFLQKKKKAVDIRGKDDIMNI